MFEHGEASINIFCLNMYKIKQIIEYSYSIGCHWQKFMHLQEFKIQYMVKIIVAKVRSVCKFLDLCNVGALICAFKHQGVRGLIPGAQLKVIFVIGSVYLLPSIYEPHCPLLGLLVNHSETCDQQWIIYCHIFKSGTRQWA